MPRPSRRRPALPRWLWIRSPVDSRVPIVQTASPIILSTGASTIEEIRQAVRWIQQEGNPRIALLHCITNYPTRTENANLNMIRDIQRAFPKLRFVNPLDAVTIPGTDRLVVVEQHGRLFSIPNEETGDKADLFADLKQYNPEVVECYGIAFHPRFPEQPYAFVWINLGWVLTVVFLPFATQLTAAYPAQNRLAIGVYLGTLALSSLFLTLVGLSPLYASLSHESVAGHTEAELAEGSIVLATELRFLPPAR